MKSKKSIIIITMLISISLFSVGCADKIEEKIGNKIGEKIVEKATDGEVDVDTKDGVSIETEDGSMKTGENLEWPKESMGSLPKPKATIINITDLKEEDSTSVILNFDKKNGGPNYMEKLIDMGYIQRTLNKSNDSVMYMGVKDDNTAVIFSYQPEEEYGSITLSRNNDAAKEYFESKDDEKDEEPIELDMSESMNWPEDSMDDIPPIKAQISSVSLNNNNVSIGFKNIGREDIASYIEEIKSLGYDIDPMETIMDNVLSYTASNDKDRSISIRWTDNEGNINYNKQ